MHIFNTDIINLNWYNEIFEKGIKNNKGNIIYNNLKNISIDNNYNIIENLPTIKYINLYELYYFIIYHEGIFGKKNKWKMSIMKHYLL